MNRDARVDDEFVSLYDGGSPNWFIVFIFSVFVPKEKLQLRDTDQTNMEGFKDKGTVQHFRKYKVWTGS